MKLKKNDTVIVISGNSKSTIGRVLKVSPKTNMITVENVNKVKKHQKPTSNNEGGIIEKILPIHVSNVAFYDAKLKQASKIGYKVGGAKKVRVAKKSNVNID